ncbi:hypothetical protein H112_06148 [Trichophyton rubrum D6]|uniref:Mitochondrial export protein Som1 n=2 Tax=Trichophyton TaxID=5550 RepID=A0A022VWH3_TRIRU|nr:hypothetical protein H100_06162 [Trichophyton rubrum MR850]EZF39822.1 hypothetical protein H102_06131 [Trichophyton rubrum CBS 100081]EZF50450.1 hypothetical protein H103_06155 [Trichophyton rubrum CBS 288.86]EZF61043.1 hypothetical protein H104_06143 [Trichophyton rubrum CBS 289.86]EZF71717.1 hypothetical protein H105_06168 [Trichophyton soudanense CBS 452.61]EZF82513.1 hypothetical protein H110_06151 [Trichophyton rubrum MR1448]EZF93195.1 hypothetical protein H113_06197 [Trichophyton rub
MAPQVESWPATELPQRLQSYHVGYRAKARKGGPIDLAQCPLYELTQYSCNPPDAGPPEPGVVRCTTFTRLFRRCANGVTAETTAWEKTASTRL